MGVVAFAAVLIVAASVSVGFRSMPDDVEPVRSATYSGDGVVVLEVGQ